MKYLNLLTVILIILKLANVLNVSGFVVFLPSLIWLATLLFLFAVYVFAHVMAEREERNG